MAKRNLPKHARDNRSQQLDPQNPKYHKSRQVEYSSLDTFPFTIIPYTAEELEEKKKDPKFNSLFPFKIVLKLI